MIPPMAPRERPDDPDVVLEHPNRTKASGKATKASVIVLLLVSAALMGIVAIGGWDALEGAKPMLIAYILIYLVLAFYAGRWSRGTLPLAAALGIVLIIFSAVAAPEWFARDDEGFTDPALDSSLIGMIVILIIPVQVLLIGFAMRGFAQDWHVEVERPRDRAATAT